MANLSNINNILRTDSLGVGINRDPLGVLEVSSATRSGIKMFNTGASARTYETYVDASGNYIIYDEDASRNDLVIDTNGNSTFAGTIITPQINLHGVGTTYLNIGNATTGTTSSDGASIGFYTGQTSLQIINRENDAIVLSTNNSPSVTILGNGNVGIGVTNPSSYDSNADNLVIGSTGANDKNGITIVGGDTDGRGAVYFADTTQNSAGYISYFHSNNSMLFGTSDTTRMRILSSYDVNIGGGQPPASRYAGFASYWVGGHGWMGGNSTGSTSLNLVLAQNAHLDSAASWKTIATDSSNYLEMWGGNFNFKVAGSYAAGTTPTWIDSLYLKNNGNVGIGTTGPSSKLSVDITSNQDGIVLSDSGTWIFQVLKSGSATNTSYLSMASQGVTNVRLHPNGDSYFNGGNVGIGETSPSSKLDVVGTNTSSNPLVELTASGTGLYQRGVRLLNGGMSAPSSIMYALGYADNTRNMGQTYFHYAGSGSTSNRLSMGLHSVDDVFNILGTGDVGIGTVLPTGKLTVETTGNHLHLRNSGAAFGRYWNFDPDLNSRLYVVSNTGTGVYIDYASTSWSSTSDESIKENIKPLENVLDKIKDYKCIEYNLIDDETKGKKIGFIAQDWVDDFAPIISKNDDGLLGMKYTETIPVLLKAIQELKAEIEILKNK